MSDVITRDQLRELIKSEKINPSDIFGSEALTGDPVVKGFTESEIKRAVAGEYAHRKRDEEGSIKAKTELEKKLEERDGEIRKYQLEAAKLKVGDLFTKQKEARKLDDKQAKFIEKRLAKFELKKIEDMEKEFNSYLDSEIDEYKIIAKEVFEVKEEQTDRTGKKVGGETHDKTDTDPDSKYLDPASNPFIKTA